jgi:hypothetical protein
MRSMIPEWICGPDESLIEVLEDAGVAAVVALVAMESLRSPNRVPVSGLKRVHAYDAKWHGAPARAAQLVADQRDSMSTMYIYAWLGPRNQNSALGVRQWRFRCPDSLVKVKPAVARSASVASSEETRGRIASVFASRNDSRVNSQASETNSQSSDRPSSPASWRGYHGQRRTWLS